MICVIDGTRLPDDHQRFMKGSQNLTLLKKGLYQVGLFNECFPKACLQSPVPVVFDFKETINDTLFCVLPIRINSCIVFAQLSRTGFIAATANDHWSLWLQSTLNELIEHQKRLIYMAQRQRQRQMREHQLFNRLRLPLRYKMRRF